MRDSTVWVFDGPRGSGKTLSAVVECALRMWQENETVFSNVPIMFDVENNEGDKKRYQSKPLNIDDIVCMVEDLRNATIFWDEMGLNLYSRNSNTTLNKLVTLVLTLIRKRKLSFIITTQAAKFIDVNVRFQMDALISCFDMSYRWRSTGDGQGGLRQMKRGEIIYQNWKDMSGINTGEQYNDTGFSYKQFLWGKWGWDLYDTNYEFDVLEAQTRYKNETAVKVIRDGEVAGIFAPVTVADIEDRLSDLPPDKYDSKEIMDYLRSGGLDTQPHVVGRALKNLGWAKRRGTDNEYFYEKVGA